MSTIHYFQRYSQQENVATNNTLLLFSRLYQHSPNKFKGFLNDLLDDTDLQAGVFFNQQERGSVSVPDGIISQTMYKNTINKIILVIFFSALISCRGIICSGHWQPGERADDKYVRTKEGDSLYVEKYANKNKKFVAEIKNGVYNGAGANFYSNGLLKDTGQYVNGIKQGFFTFYDSTGVLLAAKEYLHDTVVAQLNNNLFTVKNIQFGNGFSIDVPVTWSTQTDSAGVLLASHEYIKGSTAFHPNFTIVNFPMDNFSPDDFYKAAQQLLKKQFTGLIITGRHTRFTSTGLYTWSVYFMGTYNNTLLGGMLAAKRLYNAQFPVLVTCLAVNEHPYQFLEYKGFFETAVNSLQFQQ